MILDRQAAKLRGFELPKEIDFETDVNALNMVRPDPSYIWLNYM
jgi:hypothetical protein